MREYGKGNEQSRCSAFRHTAGGAGQALSQTAEPVPGLRVPVSFRSAHFRDEPS